MKGSVQKYNYLMVQLQQQQMLLAKKKIHLMIAAVLNDSTAPQ